MLDIFYLLCKLVRLLLLFIEYISSPLYVNSFVLLSRIDRLNFFFFISFSSQFAPYVSLATFFCKYGNCPELINVSAFSISFLFIPLDSISLNNSKNDGRWFCVHHIPQIVCAYSLIPKTLGILLSLHLLEGLML